MNTGLFRWVRLVLVAGVLGMFVWAGPVAAARKPAAPPPEVIPEKDRPWSGLPWIVGGVLSAGAIAVSLKNARRTHLD